MIYFDNNATTKVDERVVEAMLPFFSEHYGNASSKLHAFGWEAESAVYKAREQLAALINAEPSEITFTSGATESINMALKGIFKAYHSKGNHIITVKTEHKAVLDTCLALEEEGAHVTYLDVDKEGLIDPEELEKNIKPETILISVMAANNETGVIQPIERIAEIAKERKIIFFSDATQFIGKMNFDVMESGAHCLSLSAHKFHGPKGIGALYLKRKDPRVNILPILYGGGQEKGKRPGTLNVPLIVGLGKACEIAQNEAWENNTNISKLRAHFEHQILDMEGLRINGTTRARLYNTSNITLPPDKNIIPLLNKYAFSSGSACVSSSNDPSHVLKAMGLTDDDIRRSFRFSFSKYTTFSEVDLLTKDLLKN
jgi:cysteine desulfurase